MPDPATVVAGVSGPIWGATDESWLYASNMQKKIMREKAELKNGQSEFVQARWFSPKQELTGRGKIKNNSGKPGKSLIGHQLTITDSEFAGTWYLDDVTETKNEGDWLEFEFTATEYNTLSDGSSFTTTTTTT